MRLIGKKPKKIIVTAVFSAGIFFSHHALADEISFSAFSEMKDSATRIGTYLGVLGACNHNEELNKSLSSPMIRGIMGDAWDPSTTLTSTEVKEIVLEAMEESGLGFEKLSALDDIIRTRRTEVQSEATVQFNVNFQSALRICLDVMPNSVGFEKIEILPDDPIERINFFAKISPLSQ